MNHCFFFTYPILMIGIALFSFGCKSATSSASGDDTYLSYPENPWTNPYYVPYSPTGMSDSTFGSNGKITLNLDKTMLWPHGTHLAVQSDGRILVVGGRVLSSGPRSGNSDLKVIRLNANGSLDTTFNASSATPGYFHFNFGIGNANETNDGTHVRVQHIQSVDKILVGGTYVEGSSQYFAILRLNPNGTLDTSFGNGGSNKFKINNLNEMGLVEMMIQSTGKIILAGFVRNIPNFNIGLIRLNPNGTLDTTFNPNGNEPGKVLTDMGCNCNVQPYSFALQFSAENDDKIVVGGEMSTNTAVPFVSRFTANGLLDTDAAEGFNAPTGYTQLPMVSNYITSIAVNAFNQVVAAGTISQTGQSFLFLVKNNGTLETSFGNQGRTDIFHESNNWLTHVQFTKDNKILMVHTPSDPYRTMAFTRILLNGLVDPTMTGNTTNQPGTYVYDGSPNADVEPFGFLVMPDNKILLGGFDTGTNSDFILLKLK